MELDVYSPCPGGKNKKLKFCCHDLIPALNAIDRQIHGEQLQQALAAIDRQLTETPDRACLLGLRVTTLLDTGDVEAAQATADRFLGVHPENPVALALAAHTRALSPVPPITKASEVAAHLEATRRQNREIVGLLQTAMEACEETLPLAVADAFETVALLLLRQGEWVAGRDHMTLSALMSDDESAEARKKLQSINSDPGVPFILKGEGILWPAPEGYPHKKGYDEAARISRRGQWRRALAKFLELAAEAGDDVRILTAIAMLQSRLARSLEAGASYRRAAALATDPQEAFELECLAVATLELAKLHVAEERLFEIELDDADQVFERLQGDRRCVLHAVDWSEYEVTGPPPKGVFTLYEKIMPDMATWGAPPVQERDYGALPLRLATLFLFGKETDRKARLGYSIPIIPPFDQTEGIVREILAEVWREPTHEINGLKLRSGILAEIVPVVPLPLTAEEKRETAIAFKVMLFQKYWLPTPLAALDGKSPEEAARSPESRRRLEAYLAFLTQTGVLHEGALEPLRKSLGLEPMVRDLGWDDDPRTIPTARLDRIDPEKIGTEALEQLIGIAAYTHARQCVLRFGEALLARNSTLQSKMGRWGILALMGVNANDPLQRREYARRSVKEAFKEGKSPAEATIFELESNLILRDFEEIKRLLDLIRTRFDKEPGVRESVAAMLQMHGYLQPHAAQAVANATKTAHVSIRESSPASTSQDAPGLILPGEESAVPAAEGSSKIWLPGQD